MDKMNEFFTVGKDKIKETLNWHITQRTVAFNHLNSRQWFKEGENFASKENCSYYHNFSHVCIWLLDLFFTFFLKKLEAVIFHNMKRKFKADKKFFLFLPTKKKNITFAAVKILSC